VRPVDEICPYPAKIRLSPCRILSEGGRLGDSWPDARVLFRHQLGCVPIASPRTGAIKLNYPDLEVWELSESCSLDIADHGGTTLEDVGAIMNLTRERVRQVELKVLAKLEALKGMDTLRQYVEHAQTHPSAVR